MWPFLQFPPDLVTFTEEILNPFSPGILWKIGIKKKAFLNGCISKARPNSESKLTFSESSFNFLQNSVVFCTLYPRGYTAGGFSPYNSRCLCQLLAGLKELMENLIFFAVICSIKVQLYFNRLQKTNTSSLRHWRVTWFGRRVRPVKKMESFKKLYLYVNQKCHSRGQT